jgi:hypothetical protein
LRFHPDSGDLHHNLRDAILQGEATPTRAIEGMNPTMATKMMFGDPGIEGIGTQCICALQERKSGGWDDEMNEPFFGTN